MAWTAAQRKKAAETRAANALARKAIKQPVARLIKVTINEGEEDDPVFLTPSFTLQEAIAKATAEFERLYPGEKIESIRAGLEADSGERLGSEYNPHLVP